MYRFAGDGERVPGVIRGLQNSASLAEIVALYVDAIGLGGHRPFPLIFRGFFRAGFASAGVFDMDWLELRKHWSLIALLLFAFVLTPSRVTGNETILGEDRPQLFGGVQAFPAGSKLPTPAELVPTAVTDPTAARGASTAASKIANEQVGDPGDVQKIAFDGLRLFTAAQLRSQLECDLQFQAAARPSGEYLI
jgi:hypothetical protein